MNKLTPALLLILTACSTNLTINTRPEGVVVRIDGKEVGKTPLTISSSEYKENSANGMMMQLSRPGYKSVWLWVPIGRYDYNISANLTPFYLRAGGGSLVSDHEISRADLNNLTDKMLGLQKALILGESYDKNTLKDLVEANPTLGTAHFLAAVEKLREQSKEQGMVNLKDALRFAPAESDFLVLYNELSKTGAGDAK